MMQPVRTTLIARIGASLAMLCTAVFAVAVEPAGAAPPANDDFANAPFVAINGNQLPITATNVDATFEIGEPIPGCAYQGDAIQTSVWWRISVVTGGALKITTQGSDFDTQLGIYTGTSLANIQEVGCDDDNEGTLQASRVIDAPNSTVFYVQVDGFSGNTGSITLDAELLPCQSTWHVDSTATGSNDGTSWANAFTELQDGLAAAAGCQNNNALDQVLVAQGTYTPSEVGGDLEASFEIPAGVDVIGGHPIGGGASDPGAFPTILSGDLNFDDTSGGSNAENSQHVVTATSSSTTRSLLDGFIIEGGNADGQSFPSNSGGGLFTDNIAQLTVRDTTIQDNTASLTGSAIQHEGLDLTLRDVVVTRNSGAAAAAGGGAFFNADASIVTSTFENNSGFTSVAARGDLDLINSRIASSAAAALDIAAPTADTDVNVTNSILSADGDEAVLIQGANGAVDAAITNSILTGSNTALRVNDFNGDYVVQVTNSILWGNTSVIELITPGATPVTAQHSIIEGSGGSANWSLTDIADGGGNLDADPQWVDPLNDNFRLRNLSPAVNAGSPTVTVIPLDFFDIDDDGQTNTERTPDLDLTDRIKNGIVDMGPFERAPVPCQPIIYVDGDAVNGAQDGLTWANAFTDLQDGIAQANACVGVASEIWVAEGVYTPHPSDRTVPFELPHDVDVVGGFDGTEADRYNDRPSPLTDVILSGDLLSDDTPGGFPQNFIPGPDNSQGVVLVPREHDGRLFDVTVTGGNADGAAGGAIDGGGIRVEPASGPFDAGSLVVINTRVTDNAALARGGGIQSDGDLFIADSVVGANTAQDGGGISATGDLTTIVNSAVGLNAATRFGGGLHEILGEFVEIIDSDFSSNSAGGDGGAINVGAQTTVIASAFKLNSAGDEGGAIYANAAGLRVSASEFAGNNSGRLGGAVFASAPVSEVSTSTFTTNSAVLAGGAVFVDSQPTTGLTVNNSVVWDNDAPNGPEIFIDGANFNAVSVRSSIVEGSGGSGIAWDTDLGIDLGGNIDADPLFTNTNAFDFTPMPGSPAIGAGDAAVMPLDSFDLDFDFDVAELEPDFVGAPRLQGNGPEIGSREVSGGVPGPVQALPEPCVVYDSTGATGSLAGPIDGNEIRTITVSGLLPSNQGGASSCLPTDATAATFLIAADSPTIGGNFRLSMAGQVPNGGVVNFAPNNLNNANTVTVPLSSNGQVDVGANGGALGAGQPVAGVRLVALAYNAPSASSEFVPVTPCAVADSRGNQGGTGPYLGPFTDGEPYPAIDVVGSLPADQGGGNNECGIPSSADAIVVNVVAVSSTGGTGRVLIGANGTTPAEGTPFAPLGMNNAAVAIVPLEGDQTLNVDIEAEPGASTHVRLVALGYFQTADEAIFVPVNPCAAFDTRFGEGGFSGLRQGNQTTTYQISGLIDDAQGGTPQNGSCGVPVNATGVLINLVAINAAGSGNLQISAAGTSPTGGVLNFASLTPSMNNSNAVPVELSGSGEVDVFVNGGSGGIGVDLTNIRGVVLGYYILPPTAPLN